MGIQKELQWGPLIGVWAWLLCEIATGAALPVTTEWPFTDDDYTTPMILPSVINTDYFEPALPTTTEGGFAFPVETTFPFKTNGENPDAVGEGEAPSPGETLNSGLASSEDDSGSVTDVPKTFQITEDLKGATEDHLDDKNVLIQVNSSELSLEEETLKRDPAAESKETVTADVLSKETPAPILDDGHEATELITDTYSGITDAPVTILATKEEELLATPSREKAENVISSERTAEEEKPSEAILGEPNLDDKWNPTPASWEETEAVTLEPKEDTPEPSTDISRELEDPSSNPVGFPSDPEELPDQETRGSLDAGGSPSLTSKDNPETRPSAVLPSSWLSPTDATFGSSRASDFAVDSLQASPASVADVGVDSGPTGGRGDADPILSSSDPELSHETIKVPTEEPEDFVDAEASNSSPSDRTTDSVSPRDTPLGPSQSDFDVTDAPSVGLSVAPGISSQLPEDGEMGATSTMKEVEEGSGNPESNEGTPFASPLPGQESDQGAETPDGENISADLHIGTISSLNPGVETASSELEDNEATAISNSAPKGEINPTSSDSATVSENESETLFNIRETSPPPVDKEGASKAQEPPAEASAPASPNELSSEREGSEVSPSGPPGNIGSSSENSEAIPSVASGSDTNEVDTQANSEDQSGTDLSPSETELFPISGTPLPVEKSGTLNDGLSPSQSLVENTLTSGSSSSSEGEPTFPSTSPDEALSGPLISELDTTELPSNPLPGSQTSSQPPKENDTETGSEDPEDSDSINGEETSSAPSIINPQSALSGTGATEEPSISGDLGNGPTSSPKEKRIGSTSEPSVNEEPVSDSDSAQDKINTPPSEQQLSSENAVETSISSSAEIPAAKSGTISPLIIDTETSTKAQELSGEIPSSASIDGILSNSENEDGEPSPNLSSKTLDSSPSSEVADESRDGEDSTGLASATKIAVTVSNEGQPGSDLPVGQSVTSPVGEILALAPVEDGETLVTNEESPSALPNAKIPSLSVSDLLGDQLSGPSASPGSSQLSPDDTLKAGSAAPEEGQDLEDLAGVTGKETYLTPSTTELLSPDHAETFVSPPVPKKEAQLTTGAVSSEDGKETGAMSQSDSSTEGLETSASEQAAVSSQSSPDGEAAPETSKETEQLQTSTASEEETHLASSTTESQELRTSESGESSGAFSKGNSVLPVEPVGTANPPSATNKGSQSFPEDVASSDGAEGSEDISNISSEKSSQDPLDRESQSKASTSKEVTGGLSDGESSLNNKGTETASVESADNAGSQLPPDDAQPGASTASEGSEISEGPSNVSGKEGSLLPSAAESHSTSTSTEEVETANSESGTNTGSQPSLNGASTAEVQDSERAEAVEDTSNNGEKLSLASSAIESQSPGISDSEDVFGGTGNGESSLLTKELEVTGSGSTNNAEAQSVAGGATEESGVSNGVEQLESSSVNEKETSLGSSATESSTLDAPADKEVSGKLSDGDEVETANSEAANNAEPQSPPNGAGPGGATASEEAGTSVSGVSEKEGPLVASAAESQATSSSNEEAGTNNTATNTGKLSDGDEVETANSEAANNAEPQSPPNGAGPGGATASEEAGTSVSGVSEKEGSLAASAAESQATSSSNEEAGTNNTATSQLPPDGVSATGSLAPDDAEVSEVSAGVTEEKGSLSPSTAESLSDSSATEEVGTASTKSTANGGSQLSADGASPAGSLASEEAEKTESNSIVSEEKASLAPSATELQFPETSANGKVPGGLDNGESSLFTGEERANSGSSNNAVSQTSPDSVGIEGAIASEGAETSEDNSVVSEKKLSLAPSSTEPQSPATSVSKEVSEKLVNGESSLSTDGWKDTANIGTAGTQGPTSSTGTGLNQKNIAEQLGEKSDSTSEVSSVDGTKISKSSGGTLISNTAFPDGNLATKATDCSQPPSCVRVNLVNPVNTGSGENSVLPLSGHSVLSSSDTLGGSGFPTPDAQAGGKFLPGASGGSTEALASVRDSVRPSPDEETKPAAGQPSGVASPFALLPPNKVLPLGASDSDSTNPGKAAEKLLSISSFLNQKVEERLAGKVTGKTDSFSSAAPTGGLSPNELPSSSHGLAVKNGEGSSPPAPEGRGEVVSSSSAAQKGTSTTSIAGGAQPSLLGAKVSPAKTPQLPSGSTGPQVEADTPLLSPKTEVTANTEHPLAGKLLPSGPASPVRTSASDENGLGSSSSPNLSELLQTLIKSKIAFGLSKAQMGKAKSDARLALSGLGPLATKSSQPTSKTSGNKPDSDSKVSKKKKIEAAYENSAKLGKAPAAPLGPAVSLYSYGPSVNDKQYVERKVDFNSPLFKVEIGIPLGKTLRSSLYFTDNGQIIFPASDKDVFSYPNPPSDGFNGREKVPMVAAFWDNADFSKGSGNIFYQEYLCGNSPKHPLVQDVEAKIHLYVRSSYSARWLFKITWEKVQPYPAQRQNSKTNTYQAILTTDGYRTYALFLYQDGGMQWDHTKLSAPNVLIGYTSGDGYFKNDDLMTKTPAEKYRPDHFQGCNTDVRGLWIYKLDSSIRVNYRQRCLDWISHEGSPSAWNRNLSPCPCSLQQGMSDIRYSRSKKGWLDSGLTMLYSSSPNNYGAGVRCLYNKNNQLEEGRQERIWKGSRKNSPSNDEELKFYDWCCNQAGSPQLCEKYNQKRPRIGCQGYKPPVRVASSEEKSTSSEEKPHRKKRD